MLAGLSTSCRAQHSGRTTMRTSSVGVRALCLPLPATGAQGLHNSSVTLGGTHRELLPVQFAGSSSRLHRTRVAALLLCANHRQAMHSCCACVALMATARCDLNMFRRAASKSVQRGYSRSIAPRATPGLLHRELLPVDAAPGQTAAVWGLLRAPETAGHGFWLSAFSSVS